MSTKKETDSPEARPRDVSQAPISPASAIGALSNFLSSPSAKFILLGAIIFVLLIPTLMVWALVEERSQRADVVAREISQGWGSTQLVNGPYLVIPYTRLEKISQTNNNGESQTRLVTRHAIISPEDLAINGNIAVEERKKSIYKTQLYHLKSGFKGKFPATDLSRIRNKGGTPKLSDAFLVMGVSDTSGFRSDISFRINGAKGRQFLPGLNNLNASRSNTAQYRNQFDNGNLGSGSGVHVPISENDLTSGFAFEIDMALNGSRNLAFVPAGKTTQLNLDSNWPHPGFNGKFLPETRSVETDGFSATWTIPNLARGIDEMQFSSTLPSTVTAIGVNFVEPLSFYQVTSRSLKYAIGFFSLVFLAVFILELYGKSSLHWIQYILTGLAMIVFYVLLLALAEQVGFLVAYISASLATTALIAWYVGDALENKHGAMIVGTVLSVTYLVMYMILNEETYALLAGSIIAFVAIAATMFATRDIDWSNATRKPA